MICHLLMASIAGALANKQTATIREVRSDMVNPMLSGCIGSLCVMWVKQGCDKHTRALRRGVGGNDEPTGCGWCKENLDGDAFNDPAEKEAP